MDDIVSITNDNTQSKSGNCDMDLIKISSSENTLKSFSLAQSVKLAIASSILFLFMMTDVFLEQVLEPINATLVYNRSLTRKGIVSIAILLAMGIIVLDFLIGMDKI